MNVSVLGQARSPSQIAIELLKASDRGAIVSLVVVMQDADGVLLATWDDSVDDSELCRAATFLRMESERALVESQDEEVDGVEGGPGGGGAGGAD